MLFDIGCCCGGVTVSIRVQTCGGSFLSGAEITVKTTGGVVVATATTPAGTSPYWASVTLPAAGSYKVSATYSGCPAGAETTIAMTAGGSYTVTVPCNPVQDRITWGAGCIAPEKVVFDVVNATSGGLDPFGRFLFTPTGPSPTVTIRDVDGKMAPRVIVGSNPDCVQQTYAGGTLTPAAGWGCTCFVDDGVGRTSCLVSTPAGSVTYGGTIGSGFVVFTVPLPHALVSTSDPISCPGGGSRTVPSFGTGLVRIGYSWNLCGTTPTASQTLWHGLADWYADCPLNEANRRCRPYRNAFAGGTSNVFGASSYTVNSTTSPASITFNFSETPGAYEEQVASLCAPVVSAVGGSLTITEIM